MAMLGWLMLLVFMGHTLFMKEIRFESLGFLVMGIICLAFACSYTFVLNRQSIFLASRKGFRNIAVAVIAITLSSFGIFGSIQAILMTTAHFSHEGSAEYAVVLGAGIVRKEPSYTLARRLDQAAVYLSQNPEASVVVSGGHSDGQLASEAQVMKWYLENRGIDSDRILKEEYATNSLENIELSIGLVEDATGERPEKILVITSDYHLLRAKLLARRMGIETYGIAADSPPHLYPYYAAREFAALFKSMMLDWPK